MSHFFTVAGCGAFLSFLIALAVIVAIASWEDKRSLLDDLTPSQVDKFKHYENRVFACVWAASCLLYIWLTYKWPV